MENHDNETEAGGRLHEQVSYEAGGITRRTVLKGAGLISLAIAAPSGLITNEAEAAALLAEENYRPQVFTPLEFSTVGAIIERLIPTDENGPGAKQAHVDRYLDGLLNSDQNVRRGPNNPTSDLRDAYASGLRAVNSYAESRYGSQFTELSFDKQDVILKAMEENEASGFTPDSRTFFNLIREHSVWGMFSDPYYGGNAAFIGWDLLGFPGIKLVFTEEEQRLDVQVKSAHKSTTAYAFFGENRKGM